jgi:hypothetical protein
VTVPAGAPTAAPKDIACLVATPTSWKQAIRKGALARIPGERTLTVAASAGPWARFAVIGDGGRQRLVAMRAGSTTYKVIASYPAAYQSGAGFQGAEFDGRFLVYLVQPYTEDSDVWTLYSYDTRGTGAPRVIGRQQDLQVPAGPFVVPQVRNGLATWVQPLRNGTRQVHVYDLVSHRDRVVRVAHVYRSALVGDLVVWQEAPAPDAGTVLRAVNARTGRPVALPGPVAAVRQTGEVVGDGRRWFWLASDYSGIYAWQPGWRSPVLLVGGSAVVQDLGLAGDLLAYTDEDATFVVDLRTHSRTRVTAQYGVALTSGTTIEVGSPPVDGSKFADLDEWVVNAAKLPPLPSCTAGRPIR